MDTCIRLTSIILDGVAIHFWTGGNAKEASREKKITIPIIHDMYRTNRNKR